MPYDPMLVQPMREDMTSMNVEELKDAAAVDTGHGRFTVNAVANIDSDTTYDEWSQNDANFMCNGSTAGGTCDGLGDDVEY